MTEDNPLGIDALIYSTKEKGDLSGVLPDIFSKEPGDTATWVVGIWQNEITVTFPDGSPFKSPILKSVDGKIRDTIRGDAEKRIYKYIVTDSMGVSIDPRLRVH